MEENFDYLYRINNSLSNNLLIDRRSKTIEDFDKINGIGEVPLKEDGYTYPQKFRNQNKYDFFKFNKKLNNTFNFTAFPFSISQALQNGNNLNGSFFSELSQSRRTEGFFPKNNNFLELNGYIDKRNYSAEKSPIKRTKSKYSSVSENKYHFIQKLSNNSKLAMPILTEDNISKNNYVPVNNEKFLKHQINKSFEVNTNSIGNIYSTNTSYNTINGFYSNKNQNQMQNQYNINNIQNKNNDIRDNRFDISKNASNYNYNTINVSKLQDNLEKIIQNNINNKLPSSYNVLTNVPNNYSTNNNFNYGNQRMLFGHKFLNNSNSNLSSYYLNQTMPQLNFNHNVNNDKNQNDEPEFATVTAISVQNIEKEPEFATVTKISSVHNTLQKSNKNIINKNRNYLETNLSNGQNISQVKKLSFNPTINNSQTREKSNQLLNSFSNNINLLNKKIPQMMNEITQNKQVKNNQIINQKSQIINQNKQINNNQILNQKNQIVNQKNQILNQNNQILNQNNQIVNQKEQIINQKPQIVNQKEQKINQNEQRVNQKEQIINQKEQIVNQKEQKTTNSNVNTNNNVAQTIKQIPNENKNPNINQNPKKSITPQTLSILSPRTRQRLASNYKTGTNKIISHDNLNKTQNVNQLGNQTQNNSKEFYKPELEKTTKANGSIKNLINKKVNNNVNVMYNDFDGTGYVKNYSGVSRPGTDMHGKTKINQDSIVCLTNINNIKDFNIFGVLDGHGPDGHFVSKYISNYIPSQLINHPEIKKLKSTEKIYKKFKENNCKIITDAFVSSDEKLKDVEFDTLQSGTTCCLIIHIGKHILCANTGDSRALVAFDESNNIKSKILNNLKAVALSIDHKPELPEESERIMMAGGVIEKIKDEYGQGVGPFRVWAGEEDYPGLAMSRSIGDLRGKTVGIIPNPGILEYDLNKTTKFVIACSDGVFEYLNNDKVKDIGKKFYLENNASDYCHKLLKQSYDEWIKNDTFVDDITAVVAFF